MSKDTIIIYILYNKKLAKIHHILNNNFIGLSPFTLLSRKKEKVHTVQISAICDSINHIDLEKHVLYLL